MTNRILAVLGRLYSFAQKEIAAVAALVIVAGGLFIFASVADEMREPAGQSFDWRVLHLLRPNPANLHDALGPPWLEHAMGDLTALGGVATLLAFAAIAVGFLLMQRRRGSAAFLTFTLIGGLAISETVKQVFERSRPPADYRTFEVINASFPSGHALLATVFYLTIGVMLARTQSRGHAKAYVVGVAVTLALIVGVTRVWLGAHWLSDVLAGWSLGAAWAMGVWVAAYGIARGRARKGVASFDERR